MSPTALRETVPILPTSTVMATVDVRDSRLVAVSVKNLDVGVQTLTVTIGRRCSLADDFSPAQTFEDFTDIPAGAQRTVDFDCGVNLELEVRGIASGLGLNAIITVKPDGGRR
jgi:hypothetical protein